jgi:hypothetical protein
MNHSRILIAGLFLLVAAGCVPTQASGKFSAQPTVAMPTPTLANPAQIPLGNTPMPVDTPSSPPPAQKFVDLAKQDLANRLSVDVDQIAVVEATPIVWPDAALGCPSPGKVYAQGRVPGYRIILEANGMEYVYHADQTGQIVLCPEMNPDEVNPPSPSKPILTPTIHIGVPIK